MRRYKTRTYASAAALPEGVSLKPERGSRPYDPNYDAYAMRVGIDPDEPHLEAMRLGRLAIRLRARGTEECWAAAECVLAVRSAMLRGPAMSDTLGVAHRRLRRTA